jgi:Bacterial toxin 23
MNKIEAAFFFGLNWHFGAGSNSYMSGTAGIGFSKKYGFMEPGVNLAVNFYNGGIGARSESSVMHFDTVLTAKLTAGSGSGNPMSIKPLHVDSGSGLTDNYKHSATLGTNFIFNNSGRNQQVGFLQLRSGDFSFQTYNDFDGFKKLSDGYDRWWTGGGNVTIGSNKSKYQFIIASDVFTADTDSNNATDSKQSEISLAEFNTKYPNNNLSKFGKKLTEYTPSTASELEQEYLNTNRDGIKWSPDQHSFNLNQGRTSFRMNTQQGKFGINSIGQGNMYSQNIIHRIINFHLIPSERENQFEFQYSPK